MIRPWRWSALGLGVLLGVASCRSRSTDESTPPEPAAAPVGAPTESSPDSPPEAPAPDPRRPEVLARLERIGVVGASQAAGFGTGVGFRDTLDAALRVPHRIYDSSVALMHLGAVQTGELQIMNMKLRRVSTVFAIDFLFWFAYGVKSEQAREAELAQGMALLSSLGVPVVVGDLPDVHGASRAMISPRQIPPSDQIAALNVQIHDWADRHPDIVLVPLGEWMAALKQERPVMLEGRSLDLSAGEVLQWDLLHPTALGQSVLTLLVLQELRDAWGGLGPDDLLHEPAAVVDLAVPSREPAPEGQLPLPPSSEASP